MKNLFYVITIVLWAISCVNDRPEQYITFEYVDPLEKIVPEANYFSPGEALCEVVRGEHATLQFVVRSQRDISEMKLTVTTPVNQKSKQLLSEPAIHHVGMVQVGRPQNSPAKDLITSLSGYYPDPLFPDIMNNLPHDVARTVWVSVPVATTATPGDYIGRISLTGKIDGQRLNIKKDFTIKVYPPVVENTSLWVTNWYQDNFALLNDGNPVEHFSPQYWEYMGQMARLMKVYCQNVVLVSPLRLAGYSTKNGKLDIDFTNFDKTVELFLNEGVAGRIAGGHIAGRTGGWASPFEVFVPVEKDGKFETVLLPLNDNRTQAFYKQFFPALLNHLKEKGWYNLYMQHIADEPIEENVKSYIAIANFVKNLAPGVKLIDACHTKDVDQTLDVWVPQLNFLDDDFKFYREQQQKGKEVWFYTCVWPQSDYANRFIQQPLIKTRLLHWLNYKYGIDGYLHWGLNFWQGDPLHETTRVQPDGLVLPGGDAWVVYPYKGQLVPSIRFDTMRDGIVDYELLKMLEQKDSVAAQKIVSEIIYGFKKYDTGIEHFRAARRKLMESLSE